MHIVSSDYVNKNERPTIATKKSHLKNVHKTRTRVNRKIKQPPHPYDKWIDVRGKNAKVAVEIKALIKAIANVIRGIT
jgi:hypothetical protein